MQGTTIHVKKWYSIVTNVTRVLEPGCFHLETRDHLEYLDVCRRMILKSILEK